MKYLASLLITVSLVLGTVAATTAYVPRVASIDAADALTLAAPAGVAEDGTSPLVDPAAADEPITLDTDLLAFLTSAGVERVRVREFGLARWDYGWLFGLAALGLIVGAVLIRLDARNAVAASIRDSGDAMSPEQLLGEAIDKVKALRDELPACADDRARMARIMDVLDDVSRKDLSEFAEQQAILNGRLGATGYAQLMDRFAAGERQLNRAWSAAADRVLDEARVCLDEGIVRMEEAQVRLAAG